MKVAKVNPKKTVVNFVFSENGSPANNVLTVIINEAVPQDQIDVIEDAISSYLEEQGLFYPTRLVQDVLNSFGYDYDIMFSNHVFQI